MPVLDEFDLIDRFFAGHAGGGDVIVGIGDDAAVVAAREPVVIAVDTLVGGVHFPPDLAPHAIGYRSLAVNLSDLAAMGARPRWATLALTLPEADENWLAAFAAGFLDLAQRHDVALIGGDTTRGPLTITVQAIGTAPGGRTLQRGGGAAGDDVYVTGTLGDSAAAIAILAREGARWTPAEEAVVDRFRYPRPRVAAGLALLDCASAAIDVSDGLIADLGHLCSRSDCGAELDLDRLPLSPALRSVCPPQQAEAYALGGGDDYELCFTAPPGCATAVDAALAATATIGTRVGRLIDGDAVICRRAGKVVPVTASGYRHF
jgi:thiamine-monophosphate kinase